MQKDSPKEPEKASKITDLLGAVGVGTIAFVLERQGYRSTFMKGVAPLDSPVPSRMVGRARTLRTLPWREDVASEQELEGGQQTPHRAAFDLAEEGDVLVIDARGSQEAGVAGDLLIQRLNTIGARGLVTDGCIRDVQGVRGVGLPVFAAGINSTSFRSHHVAVDINVPVACGGVLIRPGDYVLGDSEGVVVIPEPIAYEIATLAMERERLDEFIDKKLKGGEPLSRVFPPAEDLMAEYQSMNPTAENRRES